MVKQSGSLSKGPAKQDAGVAPAAVAMRWNNDYLSQIEADFGDKTAQLVAESHKTAIDTLEQVRIGEFFPLPPFREALLDFPAAWALACELRTLA